MKTLISVMPFAMREAKPQIPCEYVLPASKGRPDFNILYVDHAVRSVYIGEDKFISVPIIDEVVATGIVNDLCRAMLESAPEAHPGIGYLDGKLNKDEILESHSAYLENLWKLQDAWFMRLVKLADDDYARTGMHKSISDLQRMAAVSLGLLDRPWLAKLTSRTQKCPYCASLVPVEAIVCAVCTRDLVSKPMPILPLAVVPKPIHVDLASEREPVQLSLNQSDLEAQLGILS